jgi:uncharacterized protein YdeI (YjbR/CyaY-like superfamily)
MSETTDGLPVLEFPAAQAFADWLAAHPKGAWLKFAKQGGGGGATLSKSEALDCALCHGWIDGQLARYDEAFFLVRFTPRRPGGRWSAINRARAEALIAAGRMTPRGLAEVDAARADGRWDAAYPSSSKAEVPEDFQAALMEDAEAARAFAGLDSANRYAMLYRLHHAKSYAQRMKRVETFIAMLARGERFHPPRKRGV